MSGQKIPFLIPNELSAIEHEAGVTLYYGINDISKENEIIDLITEMEINKEEINHPFLNELKKYPNHKFRIPCDYKVGLKVGSMGYSNYLNCCTFTNTEASDVITLFPFDKCTGFEKVFIYYLLNEIGLEKEETEQQRLEALKSTVPYEYGIMSSKYKLLAKNKLTAYAVMCLHYQGNSHMIAIYEPESCKEDSWLNPTGQITERLDEIFGGVDSFDKYLEDNVVDIKECYATIEKQ